MIALTLAEVASAVGGVLVLIKASRSVGWERIAQGLLASGGHQAGSGIPGYPGDPGEGSRR